MVCGDAVKLPSEMVWPEVKSAVATVNVADCAPNPLERAIDMTAIRSYSSVR